MTLKLSELLQSFLTLPQEYERLITGLVWDSRLPIKPGDIFFAYAGLQHDGRKYIDQAIEKGAVAILVDNCHPSQAQSARAGIQYQLYQNIPLITIPHLTQHMSAIAAGFYGDPSQDFPVIGVTGTNGKTSVCHYIAEILTELGQPSAVMGTVGNGLLGELAPATYTTADWISAQAILKRFSTQGVKAVAMEVSSHALDQWRVKAVHFKTAVFTNLTRDHLDYHHDMASYGAAKQRLFQEFALSTAIINSDDDFGKKLLVTLPKTVKGYSYSLQDPMADIYASRIRLHDTGIEAWVRTPWGEGELVSPVLGRFNLSNLLAAIGVLAVNNISMTDILNGLPHVSGVVGRMQTRGGKDQPLVVVDYAHTPDALEKALQALREHCRGKLWCVFGCGGDRDPGKRPQMGAIAERDADHCIITDDNPRHELSEQIAADIVAGLQQPAAARIQLDRRLAIAEAIHSAQRGDIVLIAGKGHEDYQQVGDNKYPFSDIKIVEEFLL